MAPFSTYISFLFLATLLFPLQIIARESNFFSKVPHSNNKDNFNETELPKEEEPEKNKPVFIPETENNYALNAHESPQIPSTTTISEPYESEIHHTRKYPRKYHHNYNNNDAYNTNQNEELTGTYRNNYYNKDAYEGNQNELSDTKYTEGEYNSMGNHYYNNNGEKQGMSDTRFLEGGRYFYDVKYEKYNPTLYDDSSRSVNTYNNWNSNRGNNNNNEYQNQEEFEDEQDFEP